jgi:hypothetical protein
MSAVGEAKLMRVERTVSSFEVDVQKTDAELPLFVSEFSGDHRTFSAISQFLDIEVEESPILRESYEVDR